MIVHYNLPIRGIVLLPNRGIIWMQAHYGTIHLYLPHTFYYCIDKNHVTLGFNNKPSFAAVMAHIRYRINHMSRIYMLRLRIRGLGYRIRRFCNNLYRFYFTKTNYIYMHVPAHIIIRLRKRRMIILSTNYPQLKQLFIATLLLKHTGPYNKRGFVYPRRMLFLKKGKKVT